ncbi:SDR family oxidoreductase [candidate division GN15 bacterium]|nr:SDR family oxidoreductase [candidate division GN15 bacterium]
MMRLDGKVAVITGGNSGIGLATAREYVNNGASVAIFGRDKESIDATVAELGEKAMGRAGDIRKLDDLEAFFKDVNEAFGKIDVLMANAGVAKFVPFDRVDEELFDELSDINLKGTFFTVQKALPHLNKGGSVILVSAALNRMGSPASSVYTATKAGVQALGRALAADLSGRGIRVNVLTPGPVDTPIYTRLGYPEKSVRSMIDSIARQNPMSRVGTADELARAALFLASDDSAFMTGSELVMDGGAYSIKKNK